MGDVKASMNQCIFPRSHYHLLQIAYLKKYSPQDLIVLVFPKYLTFFGVSTNPRRTVDLNTVRQQLTCHVRFFNNPAL